MYIKIAGSMILTGIGAMIGFSKAGELNERVRMLQGLKKMINFLQGELRFHRAALSEAFENVGERMEAPFSGFLQRMAHQIEAKELGDFEKVWEENAGQLLAAEGFRSEDEMLLDLLKSGLGYLDLAMQTETLNLAMIRTEEAIAEAKEESKTKGKLYQTMGVTIGALLSLMII